jgi:hypothetical protein
MSEMERLLRSALVPIEPSGAMSDRLERRLSEVTHAAAEELAEWELSAMRDPRRWVRALVAVIVGGAAAGALVLVRARQQQRRRGAGPLRALERGARSVAADVGRRLGR